MSSEQETAAPGNTVLPDGPVAAPGRLGKRLLLRWVVVGYMLLGALAIWGVNEVYGAAFRQTTGTADGTYSDFSQRWLGTRVALFERGNPYSPDLLPRIQTLYYGHALSSDDPHRPRDPQGFFYPLYAIWLFWPLALVPFPLASALFKALAVAGLVGGTRVFLDLLDWPKSSALRWGLAGLALLTLPGQALVFSDQPSVLIYGLVLGMVWALGRGRFGLAGVLLALIWIKPQLAVLLTVGVALWAGSVPTRRRTLGTFAALMIGLLGISEVWLPGWAGAWFQSLSSRPGGVPGVSSALNLGEGLMLGVRAIVAVSVVLAWWRVRRVPATDPRLWWVVAYTLAATVVVQQPWYAYNLIFLYPPLLFLLARLTAAAPGLAPPPRSLGWLTVAVLAGAWGVYRLLGLIYLAGLLPTTDLDWPGFPALSLLIGTLLNNLIIIMVLFSYIAWAGPVLTRRGAEPAPTSGPKTP